MKTRISPVIIAISGVPGVGKTDVAAKLSALLGTKPISITGLVRSGEICYVSDRSRQTKILDPHDVRKAVTKKIRETKSPLPIIVEGHLSHLIKADATFILRCNPIVLRKRLLTRKWSKPKIEENVQAEMLDIITSEAIEKRKNKIYEIDTTKKSASDTSELIVKILKSSAYGKKFRPGKIRWLNPRAIR